MFCRLVEGPHKSDIRDVTVAWILMAGMAIIPHFNLNLHVNRVNIKTHTYMHMGVGAGSQSTPVLLHHTDCEQYINNQCVQPFSFN